MVNGNPAISCYDTTNGNLKYVRATDAGGTAWGTRATLASTGNVGEYTSLAVVNGNPAISYYDAAKGNPRIHPRARSVHRFYHQLDRPPAVRLAAHDPKASATLMVSMTRGSFNTSG